MKKKVVQDVVPPKKSIRNIELSSMSRGVEKEVKKPLPKEDLFTRPVSINREIPIKIEPANTVNTNRYTPPPPPDLGYKYNYPQKSKFSKKWLYFVIALLVVVLGFGVSAMFKSASIRVAPKQEVMNLSQIFTAKKDETGNNLGFQVVTVTKDIDETLDSTVSTTQQRVDKKAQGKIVIYNNYSSDAQKLVVTTRFQTPEGLIFRLVDPVTVPGKTTKDGKVVAGSIEVTVEADKTGIAYNIGLKDFTIPGFKGDTKYTDIYARSKTEMSGGFAGMQKVVSKAVLDKEDTNLVTGLKTSLSKDIASQIPADFILFNDSLSYKFEPVTQVNDTTGNVVLKKRGSASAIIFDKGSLTRAIISKILPNTGGDVLKITNLESLNFAFQASSSGSSIGNSVTFNLKGQPNVVWVFDENKLKSDLLGLSKTDANKILQTYGAIKEAWMETRPFWSGSIPNDPKKVTLTNTLSE